ncbi:MAG: hypothetical protein M3N68_08940, partial [Actinomycetota bacterium]|nr:hypothetical protein [Actinomycetota bacterium]
MDVKVRAWLAAPAKAWARARGLYRGARSVELGDDGENPAAFRLPNGDLVEVFDALLVALCVVLGGGVVVWLFGPRGLVAVAVAGAMGFGAYRIVRVLAVPTDTDADAEAEASPGADGLPRVPRRRQRGGRRLDRARLHVEDRAPPSERVTKAGDRLRVRLAHRLKAVPRAFLVAVAASVAAGVLVLVLGPLPLVVMAVAGGIAYGGYRVVPILRVPVELSVSPVQDRLRAPARTDGPRGAGGPASLVRRLRRVPPVTLTVAAGLGAAGGLLWFLGPPALLIVGLVAVVGAGGREVGRSLRVRTRPDRESRADGLASGTTAGARPPEPAGVTRVVRRVKRERPSASVPELPQTRRRARRWSGLVDGLQRVPPVVPGVAAGLIAAGALSWFVGPLALVVLGALAIVGSAGREVVQILRIPAEAEPDHRPPPASPGRVAGTSRGERGQDGARRGNADQAESERPPLPGGRPPERRPPARRWSGAVRRLRRTPPALVAVAAGLAASGVVLLLLDARALLLLGVVSIVGLGGYEAARALLAAVGRRREGRPSPDARGGTRPRAGRWSILLDRLRRIPPVIPAVVAGLVGAGALVWVLGPLALLILGLLAVVGVGGHEVVRSFRVPEPEEGARSAPSPRDEVVVASPREEGRAATASGRDGDGGAAKPAPEPADARPWARRWTGLTERLGRDAAAAPPSPPPSGP